MKTDNNPAFITSEFITQYAAHLSELGCKAATEYVRYAKRFVDFAGKRELSTELLAEYLEYINANYNTNASKNSILHHTNDFLKFIGKDELCLPYFDLDRRLYNEAVSVLSDDELEILIDYANTHRKESTGLIIRIMAETGLRSTEIANITVESLEKGYIDVSYIATVRRVTFAQPLTQLLLEYARRNGIAKGAIFLTQNGAPLSRHTIWSSTRKLAEKAKIPSEKVTSVALRQYYAEHHLGKTLSVADVSASMGYLGVSYRMKLEPLEPEMQSIRLAELYD